jgi:hypothetical protein
MGQQGKSLCFHPYRRHTSTPTHFPSTHPGFLQFRTELPHRTTNPAVFVAAMGCDTACLTRPANGIDQAFPF